MRKKLVVIVDAYGPARHYVEYFAKYDVLVAHLLSSEKTLRGFSLANLEKYVATMTHAGNLETTAEGIRKVLNRFDADLLCVMPGVEPGVLLADALSDYFSLQTNGMRKSKARRDKFLMAEEVHKSGLATPKYFKSADFNEILDFATKVGSWPLVLKPLSSAGTNGVHICHSTTELLSAFTRVIGQVNNLGLINNEVLIQTFLEGPEYSVNTVSLNGRHFVSDIWLTIKTFKLGFGSIYDRCILQDMASPLCRSLSDYVGKVLDALGIQFGPANTEVIMTLDGPVLVESGARVSGSCEPKIMHECLHHNQMELTVDSYAAPSTFDARTQEPYKVYKNGMRVFFVSSRSGIVKSINLEENLKNLPTYLSTIIKIKVGDKLNETIDLATTAGFCCLASEDTEALERDYRKVLKIFEESIELHAVN